MQELIDHIKRRMEHCTKLIEAYAEAGGDNYHAGWSLGYWEGRLAAFDQILGKLEDEGEAKDESN